MIERSYDAEKKEYVFDNMFSYIAKYWKRSDLAIGVFEGPMAGSAAGYSTSTYDDGFPLYLNFPDSFGYAVKKAGMNLVTLANNHLFDMGVKGQERTLNVMDSIGLEHVGSYRNQEEHDKIKMLDVRGKKVAILSYTYGCERTNQDFFFNPSTSYKTDVIVGRWSRYYRRNRKKVMSDFQRVKKMNPDLIIVLPHMGNQFRHLPDENQLKWCDLFVQQGADIVFSCHPHAVQPIEWRRNPKGCNTLIVHCPGNFINSYISHDGDASMIVEAYLDAQTGKPFAVGVVPLYCYCSQNDGRYEALPIYKAVSDEQIYSRWSAAEYKRLEYVHTLITKTAIGVELNLDSLQERYISFAQSGYHRHSVPPLMLDNSIKDSALLTMIQSSSTICMVGDSITDGMKNGGYGWYEPIMSLFPDKKVCKVALGGMTSNWFRQQKECIAACKAELYIFAFGCNDIRYRNKNTCAMDAGAYIENVNAICKTIRLQRTTSQIVLISPWMSYEPDPYCNVSVTEKMKLYGEYAQALESYAKQEKYLYIDPNPYIKNIIEDKPYCRNLIYKDHIHPNAGMGIQLFSKACLVQSIINKLKV